MTLTFFIKIKGNWDNQLCLYEEYHINPILDVIREGKFRWLRHIMRRAPPSMLLEVVN